MAYQPTGVRCMVPRLGAGPAIWMYNYTGAEYAGLSAGGTYFTDGRDVGLKSGDLMIGLQASASASNLWLAQISSISSNGGAGIFSTANL